MHYKRQLITRRSAVQEISKRQNMTIATLIFIVVLVTFVALHNLYCHLKCKFLKQGYKEGQEDLVTSIIDKATWFSGTNYIAFNVLYLFALRQKKYGHVSPEKFRNAILGFHHSKRITDLPKDEFENLIDQ